VKEHGVPDDYQIGAGDVLQIVVWKEPEASVPGVVVRPDGKITMPLTKEISVIGMTPTEAEKYITGRLSTVITDADVTVIVKEIRSKKIYLIGAVKREGPMAYTYRMNIMQALSEAGGLTDYAKRKKIYVLRTEKGKDYRFHVDYDSLLKGERMEMNIPLLAGDTVVVPH
jgi:polysaccharide export outer membrane protein